MVFPCGWRKSIPQVPCCYIRVLYTIDSFYRNVLSVHAIAELLHYQSFAHIVHTRHVHCMNEVYWRSSKQIRRPNDKPRPKQSGSISHKGACCRHSKNKDIGPRFCTYRCFNNIIILVNVCLESINMHTSVKCNVSTL